MLKRGSMVVETSTPDLVVDDPAASSPDLAFRPISSYDFKFYRLLKYSSYSEIAVYAALLILAVFLNCNIHTIWGVLEQYKILPYPTRTMYNVSLGLIFILLCIRFCWKRRYKAVIEKFNEKPNKNNLLILILYIFLSLFLFVLEAFYSKGKI